MCSSVLMDELVCHGHLLNNSRCSGQHHGSWVTPPVRSYTTGLNLTGITHIHYIKTALFAKLMTLPLHDTDHHFTSCVVVEVIFHSNCGLNYRQVDLSCAEMCGNVPRSLNNAII